MDIFAGRIDMTYRFEARKCPVGSLAQHPVYGMCEVKEANSLLRGLEYRTPGSCGVDVHYVTTDVRGLVQFDVQGDLGGVYTRGCGKTLHNAKIIHLFVDTASQ